VGLRDDAVTCIDQALILVETTKETMFEADIVRMTGELALKTLRQDAYMAQTRHLTVTAKIGGNG
jgi:hypothetical protein